MATPFTGITVVEAGVSSVMIPGGEMHVSLQKVSGADGLGSDPAIACLDARDVKFPLLVRRWKAGDYFYPLGMRRKQKVARFLIHAKVDRLAKEHVLVVESDRRILWVVGRRIDDRFKVTANTRERLVLSVLPH